VTLSFVLLHDVADLDLHGVEVVDAGHRPHSASAEVLAE
jgi:hypothetical protein